MRKWLIGAICAALVVVAPKEAAAVEDGHQLLHIASSEAFGDRLSYLSYVFGVSQAYSLALAVHELPPSYCLSGTKNEDFADAVRIWLRRNPELLDWSPTVLVVLALKTYFPCEGEADDE